MKTMLGFFPLAGAFSSRVGSLVVFGGSGSARALPVESKSPVATKQAKTAPADRTTRFSNSSRFIIRSPHSNIGTKEIKTDTSMPVYAIRRGGSERCRESACDFVVTTKDYPRPGRNVNRAGESCVSTQGPLSRWRADDVAPQIGGNQLLSNCARNWLTMGAAKPGVWLEFTIIGAQGVPVLFQLLSEIPRFKGVDDVGQACLGEFRIVPQQHSLQR